jgi:L-2,4-diaminobutyrate decarboxylase
LKTDHNVNSELARNFFKDGKQVLSRLSHYLDQSMNKEIPVIHQRTIEEIHECLGLETHIQKGSLKGDALDQFLKSYLANTTQLHHPGYMAHQVGNPHPTGALGSLIDGLTNNPMAIYEMGPAAAAIEFFMVNYLLARIGWEKMPSRVEDRLTYSHGAGVLTHGGSLANMTALLTARNHLDSSIREQGNPSDLVILAPDTSHYSVAKAAGIIGIGEKNVIPLETDPSGRIKIETIEQTIQKTLDQNHRIVALVANACATGTGLYDPIDEIGDICNEKQIWLHIDGAHGASAMFSAKYQGLVKGLHKADSLILDAHKMLRTPIVCASLLVKNASALDHTFDHKASYLFHEKKQPGFDFIGQTIECTKAGLGLKFFLSFAALGEQGMADYIDGQNDLTLAAYEYIRSQPDFDTPFCPESNILCFRYNGSNKIQLFIRDCLIDQGNFHISSTDIGELKYLRIVCISPATTLSVIQHLIDAIRKIAADFPVDS